MKLPWFSFVVASLSVASAYAQNAEYPNRPIKVVVPFTAGAGSDTSARFFGDQLSAKLGQPVLVENRPGASGAIGITTVKNAPADGYTILLASNSPMTVNPVMMKSLPYDPIKEFKPVYGLIRNANVFIVPPGSQMRTIADLVAAARERPLNAGTAASGYHIVLEWFASVAGVKFNNVPYKGGAAVYNDVASGQIDWAVAELAGSARLLKSGRVRALAIADEQRNPEFPDVPTIQESGFPEFVTYSWNSFYVRAETPDDITAKLANAMREVLMSGSAREFAKTVDTQLMPLGPDEMRKFQLAEYARFRSIAEAAGIGER